MVCMRKHRAGRVGGGSSRQSGYMLLFLMMAVAMMTITLLSVAANYRRTILRDREVEMIHRGAQYERAVRLYYKKFGSYPTTIDQLEETNKIRFLRKRYKDPMTQDGVWQVAHITDIKLTGLTGLTAAMGGAAPAANPLQASAGLLGAAASQVGGSAGIGASSPAAGTDNSSAAAGSSPGSAFTGGGPAPSPAAADGSQASGPAGGSGTGPTLVGGPMLGVISKSKAQGIHSFNDKDHYNEWYFIYDPAQDKGQLLTGPYNPNMLLTGSTGVGTGQPGSTGSPTTTTPTTGAPTQAPGTTMAPSAPAPSMP